MPTEKKEEKTRTWEKVLSSRTFTQIDFGAASETLLRGAASAISSDETDEEEKRIIASAIDRFKKARAFFECDLLDAPAEVIGDRAIDNAAALLFCTMAFALYRPPTSGMRRKINELAGKIIRGAKEEKNKARTEQLREYLKARAIEKRLVNSEKYAESLRNEVDFQSILNGKWPSARTIRRAIEAVLAERETS